MSNFCASCRSNWVMLVLCCSCCCSLRCRGCCRCCGLAANGCLGAAAGGEVDGGSRAPPGWLSGAAAGQQKLQTRVTSAGRAPRSRAVDRNSAPFTMSLSSFSHGSARCCLPRYRGALSQGNRLMRLHTCWDIDTTRHNTDCTYRVYHPSSRGAVCLQHKKKSVGAYWASLGGARTIVSNDDATAQQRRKDTAATTTSPRNLSQGSLRSPLLPGHPCTRLRYRAGSFDVVGILPCTFQNLCFDSSRH